MGWLPLTLVLLLCFTGQVAEGFTAYDCSNRGNVVEAYSLLEPDACANMGKEGEVETTVYVEIQIKQDRMIPVFRCIIILRNLDIAILRHVLGGWSREIHQVQGAQGIGSLGLPPGKEDRQDRHQRPDT
jgi:hypothetical protein